MTLRQVTWEQVVNSSVTGIRRSAKVPVASRRRLEIAWTCASLLALIVSWDAAMRLDEKVPLPRLRVAQETDPQRVEWTGQ